MRRSQARSDGEGCHTQGEEGEERQGDCAEQPQIWLRLGSALLFIFRLKSAQKPRWGRRSCSPCWHVSVSNARVATGVLLLLTCQVNVKFMANCQLKRGKARRSEANAHSPDTSTLGAPSGQVHHFPELKTVSYKCDLTTSYATRGGKEGLLLAALKRP